ncbi:MAG: hypothetical protein K2O70_01915 [Desulfovibrionaceae bacterium]|nr:hypothetical protein [Desulfovibrionaceae bacterium]
MLIHHKPSFIRGILLLGSFLVLFAIILSPVFKDENGKSTTGLHYADSLFNSLSKGSSYFIPTVRRQVEALNGKEIAVTVTLKKADRVALAVEALKLAGAEAAADGDKITYRGDLGKILGAAVNVGDYLYHNNAEAVRKEYNAPALAVSAAWWHVLTPSIKELQKQRLIAEAGVVDQVIRRAIEPGNNFYSVPPSKVSDHLLIMSALLIFYVIYTLWYGFAIFELFDGIGLTMTKSKMKQEA